MLKDTILTTSFRSKNIFSINEISESKNIFKKLSEEDVIVLEKEVYEYYKTKLENFTVRYESSFDTKNTFLLYQGNTTFNEVFNFYLKIISPESILNEAISNREIYLASVKQRNDEWKAAKANAASVAAPDQVKQGNFSF
jgi:hypothetical protein